MVLSLANTKPSPQTITKDTQSNVSIKSKKELNTEYHPMAEDQATQSSSQHQNSHFEVMGLPHVKTLEQFLDMHIN